MAGKRYIPDGFVGSVTIHDVGEDGGSVSLLAGDEIPAGAVIGSHIKTTTTKPLSLRRREAEREFRAETGQGDPDGDGDGGGDGDPGAEFGTGERPTFEPGKHTVAEVTQYLQDHPDDAGRVFELEEAGQQRAGILGKRAE